MVGPEKTSWRMQLCHAFKKVVEDEASGAGENSEEAEVLPPKVVLHRAGGAHCRIPDSIFGSVSC